MLKKSLAARQHYSGPENMHIGLALNSLGLLYEQQGKLETARDTFLEAVSTMERQPDTEDSGLLIVITNLASMHEELGEEREAEVILTQSLDTIRAIDSMAEFWEKRGRDEDIKYLWRRVSRARTHELGPRHSLTLDSQMNLSRARLELEDYQQAVALAETVVQEKMRDLGQSSSLISISKLCQLLEARLWLGICYFMDEQWSKAEELVEEVMLTSRDLRREMPLSFLLLQSSSHYWTGSLRWKQERMDEARDQRRQALRCCEELPEPVDNQTVMCMAGLANVLYEMGKDEEVESLAKNAIRLSERTHCTSSKQTSDLMKTLGYCYFQQGRFAEAKPLLDRAVTLPEPIFGLEDHGTLCPLHRSAICTDQLGDYEEAETLYKRAIDGFVKQQGLKGEDTIACMGNLLGFLHRRGKHDELNALRAEWADKGVTFTAKHDDDNKDTSLEN
ncbi:MAG: hypothetical protein Q9179_002158 [Wetmoreana sp. 5 TL-2023]